MWAAVSCSNSSASAWQQLTAIWKQEGGRRTGRKQEGKGGGVGGDSRQLAKHEGCLSGAVSPDALLMQM